MQKILWLILFFCASAFAIEGGESWINLPVVPFVGSKIEKSEIYEVAASKEIEAVEGNLNYFPFVEIDEKTANYYTNSHFSKRQGFHIYLVRAVYTNVRTGEYIITKMGSSIFVNHGSLGESNSIHKTALVVNLNFKLQSIFTGANSDL